MVSKKAFSTLDAYLWRLTYKWATRSHANKSRTWVSARYFGKFNRFRNDRWVFGDRDSGAYLVKFAWTDIVRHTMVKGGASPDDPSLADYWCRRRSKTEQFRRSNSERSQSSDSCSALMLGRVSTPRSRSR